VKMGGEGDGCMGQTGFGVWGAVGIGYWVLEILRIIACCGHWIGVNML